jgi:hypothetical protein
VGSNLTIGTRLAWIDQAQSLVFSAVGGASWTADGIADLFDVLFDKWFEERETQAAESWRIRGCASARWIEQNSGELLRFSHHHGASGSGQPGQDAFCVKVPVTQRFLG